MTGGWRRATRRAGLGALAVALAAFAWPMAASAQSTRESLAASPVNIKRDFKLSLKANGGADPLGEFSSLSIELDRRNTHSSESVVYRFTAGVSFAGSGDLSSAQVSGTLLEGRGSIDMSFAAASGPAAVPVPKGCTGTPGLQRSGTLTGPLALNADRLGTVDVTTMRATLTIPPDISECSAEPPHRSQGIAIEAEGNHGGGGAYVFAFKPSRRGSAREGVTRFESGHGFSFSWSYAAVVPRSDYSFSSDLATASLTGADGIHGKASYRGSPAHGGASHGALQGGLWAKFTSIGAVRPFSALRLHADQFHV